MKAKMSFDSARLKQFFAAHGEKLGFVVGLVLAGMFIYSAFGVKNYDKTPDQLKQDVTSASANLNDKDPNVKKWMDLDAAEVKPPDESFVTTIDRLLVQPISGVLFGGIEWNRPLFDTKQRRTEPVYLALEELRTSFHYGPIYLRREGEPANVNPNAAGNQQNDGVIAGQEWICVTGLVPLEAQAAAHRKAFQFALDATRNAEPVYPTYILQRAELQSGQSPDSVDWATAKTIDLKAQRDDVVAAWNKTGDEVAEPQFVRAPLTQPLPPVVDPLLGEWAAHVPEVPVRVVAPAAPGGNVPVGAPGFVPQQNQPQVTEQKRPQYLLFRFLDFDIEPTKQYCYRVQLVLANPNFGLDLAHLEKPALAQGETRDAPWSKPSTAARFPILDSFLAGETSPVNSEADPVMSLAAKIWIPFFGAEVYFQYEDRCRGALLNRSGAEVWFRKPGTQNEVEKQVTELNTNALLVDFSWGPPGRRRTHSPHWR